MSFSHYDLISPFRFIGIANYKDIFSDPIFYLTLKNTFYYTIVDVLGTIGLSFLVALGMNSIIKGRKIYQACYFIPVVSSWVVVAFVWKWIYDPSVGFLNFMLAQIGIMPRNWLSDPNLVLTSIIAVSIWRGIGYIMIIFLAGLGTIPTQLYEAARLDGAGGWGLFWNITLPLLTPTILFLTIIRTIGSFQAFIPVFLMSQGGPAYRSTLLILRMYQVGFETFRLGSGATYAVISFLILFPIILLQKKIIRER